MTSPSVLSLVQNTAILLSFAMLYDYFWAREEVHRSLLAKLGAGFVAGTIGLVLMMTPWTILPGLVFDTRTILLSVCGLFFGLIPTTIAMVILCIFRMLMGGDGMWMGLVEIVSSGVIGMLWRFYRPGWREKECALELLSMGLLVHSFMILGLFLLPDKLFASTFRLIILPIFLIYIPGTMFLGLLLLSRATSWKNKKALIETRALYISLADHMPAGLFRKDAAGRYSYANKRYCALKGLNEEEILGKRPDEVVEYEAFKDRISGYDYIPRQRTLAKEGMTHHDWIMSNGKTIEVEEAYPQPDGRVEYFQVIKTPVFDMNGKVIGSQGMQFDITLQKMLQVELMEAKEKAEASDRLKTAFLHNISHEIRTPMNSIIGFSDFLKESDISLERRIHFTDIIIQSGKQLLSIIEDIVRISTIEAGQEIINESDVQINILCQLVYDQFSGKMKQAGIEFGFKPGLPDTDARIVSDETKVLEIITNLLVNALKFTKQGQITFGYKQDGNELIFFVEDTGIGIPENMRVDVFKRFTQVDSDLSRQYGGSGLGLSISKGYVELLGGRIWVEANSIGGSTFYFTLPYRRSVAVSSVSSPFVVDSFLRKDNKPVTILVAEDEELNFILLREILLPFGAVVLRAENGAKVVETVTNRSDIDLLLLDLSMPVMTGTEAARRVKLVRPELPIIVITAYSEESEKEKAMGVGCDEFIRKPFNKNDLIEKIRFYLNEDES